MKAKIRKNRKGGKDHEKEMSELDRETKEFDRQQIEEYDAFMSDNSP